MTAPHPNDHPAPRLTITICLTCEAAYTYHVDSREVDRHQAAYMLGLRGTRVSPSHGLCEGCFERENDELGLCACGLEPADCHDCVAGEVEWEST